VKIIDGWFVRQFDLAGYYLQTNRNWHIVDIWKFGTGGLLALSTVVMLSALTNIMSLFTVAPYAIMWGFYLAIMLPWLSRQKQTWSMQRMVWWFLWAERLRMTFPVLRLVVFLAVLVFAFAPSILNYAYGYQESWLRFALTVCRSGIMPGGAIFATYLMSIHPVPPGNKSEEKKTGFGEWVAKPGIAASG
jgi:hypothetical protein